MRATRILSFVSGCAASLTPPTLFFRGGQDHVQRPRVQGVWSFGILPPASKPVGESLVINMKEVLTEKKQLEQAKENERKADQRCLRVGNENSKLKTEIVELEAREKKYKKQIGEEQQKLALERSQQQSRMQKMLTKLTAEFQRTPGSANSRTFWRQKYITLRARVKPHWPWIARVEDLSGKSDRSEARFVALLAAIFFVVFGNYYTFLAFAKRVKKSTSFLGILAGVAVYFGYPRLKSLKNDIFPHEPLWQEVSWLSDDSSGEPQN